MTAFLFGPLGYMQPVAEVAPAVSRSHSRGRGELVTVGGVRYAQKSRHAPRQWDMQFGWQSPDVVGLLQAAAQGVLKDCWLYDVAGARANMLPPHLTAGSGAPVLVGWARRNLVPNPRHVTSAGWSYQPGIGEVSATTTETGAGPNGLNGFGRRTITTAKTSGNSGPYRNEAGVAGTIGDAVTGSLYVRSSTPVTVQLNVTCRVGSGSTAVGSGSSGYIALQPNVWTRLSATATAMGDYGNVQVWCIFGGTTILPAGNTFDFTQMQIEKSPVATDYFDGDTMGSRWVGVPSASASVSGGLPLGAVQSGQVATVPVLAGRTYTVSAWSETNGNVLSYRLGSGGVIPVAVVNGRAVATFTPSLDQTLTVTVTAAGVSGLRVHEGTPDGAWLPGHGTPCRVDVIDPEATLQMVTNTQNLADYTVTLQEVGIPGVI